MTSEFRIVQDIIYVLVRKYLIRNDNMMVIINLHWNKIEILSIKSFLRLMEYFSS